MQITCVASKSGLTLRLINHSYIIPKWHIVIYRFKENLILYKIENFSVRFTFQYIDFISNLHLKIAMYRFFKKFDFFFLKISLKHLFLK